MDLNDEYSGVLLSYTSDPVVPINNDASGVEGQRVTTVSIGQSISNRYLLEKKLGSGGMGAVYQAFDRLTGQTVALKRVLTDSSQDKAAGTALRLALAREFQVLASLRHPNVISVLDYGFDSTRQPYFTMVLLDQPRNIYEAARGQTIEVRIRLLIQLLQALVYLHRRGVVHRDLKPDNALILPDGQLKVLDFGLAIGRKFGIAGEFSGTPAYMAPEVVQGETPTESSDLYAVGVIAYELLTGRHPFATGDVQQLLRNIVSMQPDMEPIRALNLTPVPDSPSIHSDPTQFSPESEAKPISETLRADENVVARIDQEGLRTLSLDEALKFEELELSDEAFVEAPSANKFEAVIRKLLAKRPERRYLDARQVIEELTVAIGDSPKPESPELRESFLQAAAFVGREKEMEQLNAALTGAQQGRGSLWLVGGESGVGKSRLLDELRVRAMVEGVLVLRGQAISIGGLPYQMWRDPLHRLLLTVNPDDSAASVLKPLVPDVSRLLKRPVADADTLEVRDSQQRLMSTIASIFQLYLQTTSGSLLVVLEDLQWASESLDILKALLPIIAENKLLIVADFRTDEAPDLSERLTSGNMLRLQRLDKAQIAELSVSMLGQAGKAPQIVTLLEKESEGNIFFAIEVLRALAEEAGQLDRVAEMELPERVLPGGIQQVLQRRLERVPEQYRSLLELAAISGRQIDLALLTYLSQQSIVDTWLTACANAAVIELQDEQWHFAHDKLREHLTMQLSVERRIEAHQQVAAGIEKLHADSLMEHAASLAYHWAQAHNPEKERHYSILAGKQAIRVSAYTEAKAHLERALALVPSDGGTDTSKQKIDIMIELGDVHQGLGNYDAATELLNTALSRANDAHYTEQMSAALLSLGWVSLQQGDLERAKRQADDALQHVRTIQHQVLEGRILQLAGLLPLIEGNYANAEQYLEDGLKIARAVSDRSSVGDFLNALGAVYEGLGHHDRAYQQLIEARDIGKDTGNRNLAANAAGNLGRLLYQKAAYAEARQYFEQALDLFREIGNAYGEATALYFSGFIDIFDKRYSEAFIRLRGSIEVSTNIGAVTVTLIALCGLARLWAMQGQETRAIELLGSVFAHPASKSDIDIEKEGTSVLDSLQARMPDLEAAFERGKIYDFDEVIRDILTH